MSIPWADLAVLGAGTIGVTMLLTGAGLILLRRATAITELPTAA